MNSIWRFIKGIMIISLLGFFAAICVGILSMVRNQEGLASPKSPAILAVDLKGVILDGKKTLKALRKYAADSHIKGVLIRVDSPGGIVGPSQELYYEIKRVREVLKKPVVVSGGSLVASGAYYAAVAADKIIVNPATMVGSIGVIMELVNLEKLYDWAKIKRYTIKTGAYKDTGAEYRAMRPDEEKYLQSTIDEVLGQFRKAVADGRKISFEKVVAASDGRIFNGTTAKEMGLVDEIGTYSDAIRAIGQMTGLGEDPNIFDVPKDRSRLMDLLAYDDSEEVMAPWNRLLKASRIELSGMPLYLMPGVWTGATVE